ncbi:MAG TPA: ABC transporter ATP-binding protein [Verrucomicrobiales bacterium]|nr:ABC transporter ATP-binding protein [Verrucomicrobiales bacterium]
MSGPPNNRASVGLRVTDLHKSYDGNPVLKGINLEVAPGEVFVLMGPSGSGKSVLLRQLIGLETPDSGAVNIDGRSVSDPTLRAECRLAMVFQSGALLTSLTVGANVGLYLAEHRLHPPERIAEIVSDKLELVGLKGQEDRQVSELSGGMRKRVAIARALVMEPHLILYDEPTSELDPLSALTIAEEIVHLNRRIGATSIVVTHERELGLGIADRVGVLFGGELLQTGKPEEIRHSRVPAIQKFLNVNFRLKSSSPSTP